MSQKPDDPSSSLYLFFRAYLSAHNCKSVAKHANPLSFKLFFSLSCCASAARRRQAPPLIGQLAAPIAQDGDDWIMIASPNRMNDYIAGSDEWICALRTRRWLCVDFFGMSITARLFLLYSNAHLFIR
jgi:hypothetical protein